MENKDFEMYQNILYQCLLNLCNIKRCIFVIDCFDRPFEVELSFQATSVKNIFEILHKDQMNCKKKPIYLSNKSKNIS